MSFCMRWVSGTSNPDLTETTTSPSCGTGLKRVTIEFLNTRINNNIILSFQTPKCKLICSLTVSRIVFHLGKKNNFNSYDETESSSLGVPYDYGSVMHYSKTSFSKEREPTIVTKIPEFLDVIGQRMEFSDSDLLKLNRLYNCSKFMIKHFLWNNPPLFFINILTLV